MPDSLRDRQHALREEMILDAAYNLMRTDGYHKMSMDALAAQVGIAKMTLYQHFPSKEAIAVGVIVRGMQRVETALLPVINASQPAIARLRVMLAAGLENRSTLWAVELDLIPGTIQQHPDYQAQVARFTAHWISLIELAKAEGDIAPSLATPVLARLLIQAFQTDYDDLLRAGAVSRAELAHTLLSVLMRGMQGASDGE